MAPVNQKIKRPHYMGLSQKLTIEDKSRVFRMIEYKPHEGQALIHESQVRNKVVCCGRRWGKSMCAGAEAMAIAAVGGWAWIVSHTYDLAGVIFDQCKDYAKLTEYKHLVYSIRSSKGDQVIETRTGGLIGAKSSDKPDSLIGRGLDLVIQDEASKEKRKTVYEQQLGPALSDRIGGYMPISTPSGLDWFYDLWMLGNNAEHKENWQSFRFPTFTNPLYPRSEVERARNEITERTFRQEYLAEFLEDGGAIFVGVDAVSILPSGTVLPGPFVMGVDLAKYEDYTAISILDVPTMQQVYMEAFQGMPWEVQCVKIAELSQQYMAPVLIDSTGVGDPILERLDALVQWAPVEGYKFTTITKTHLINQASVIIERGEISLIDDEKQKRELKSYHYEKTDAGNLKMTAPSGQHDDRVIALSLSIEMAMRYCGTSIPSIIDTGAHHHVPLGESTGYPGKMGSPVQGQFVSGSRKVRKLRKH